MADERERGDVMGCLLELHNCTQLQLLLRDYIKATETSLQKARRLKLELEGRYDQLIEQRTTLSDRMERLKTLSGPDLFVISCEISDKVVVCRRKEEVNAMVTLNNLQRVPVSLACLTNEALEEASRTVFHVMDHVPSRKAVYDRPRDWWQRIIPFLLQLQNESCSQESNEQLIGSTSVEIQKVTQFMAKWEIEKATHEKEQEAIDAKMEHLVLTWRQKIDRFVTYLSAHDAICHTITDVDAFKYLLSMKSVPKKVFCYTEDVYEAALKVGLNVQQPTPLPDVHFQPLPPPHRPPPNAPGSPPPQLMEAPDSPPPQPMEATDSPLPEPSRQYFWVSHGSWRDRKDRS